MTPPKNINQNRQDDELWISVLDKCSETQQRQDINDYNLVQNEYLKKLKKLTVTDNLERICPQDM